jgi:hypothetical protein
MDVWLDETSATLQARQGEVNNINNPRPSGNRRWTWPHLFRLPIFLSLPFRN